MFGILIALLVMNIIVLIHEFGHYIFARIGGIGVEVFSVGVGTPFFTYVDSRGTKWQLCYLPFGGYIQPKETLEVVGKNFKDAGVVTGVFVASAGPLFNFFTAFFCLMFIANYKGFPEFSPCVSSIVAKSVAENNGLQAGDIIKKINDRDIKNISDITFVEEAKFVVQRGGKIQNIVMHNVPAEKSGGIVANIKNNFQSSSYGIVFSNNFRKVGYYESVVLSAKYVINTIYFAFSKFFDSIIKLNLRGPIGIMHQAAKEKNNDIVALLLFIVSLSIGVGVFNLMPLPILDGGRILIFIASAIIRRPIPMIVEQILNYISIGAIGAIFVITLLLDLKKLI